jgi:hypothetical protein
MVQWVFEFTSPDLQAKIEITSALADPGESHIYTQLLAHLIEQAPTDSWHNNPKELTPQQFHGIILATVARRYSVDFDPDFKYPAHEIVQILINDTKDELLQEILPVSYDNEDDGLDTRYSLRIWRK